MSVSKDRMVEIGKILGNLLSEQKKLKEINKEVKEIKNNIKGFKESAKEFMDEVGSKILDCGTHEVAMKTKVKKPTLNRKNQEAWTCEFFRANDLDESLAMKLVDYYQAKITEGSTESEFVSVTKAAVKKKRKKKKTEDGEDEPAPKKSKAVSAVEEDVEEEVDMSL